VGYKNIHLVSGNVSHGNWDAIPIAMSDDANAARLADQRLAARRAEAKREAQEKSKSDAEWQEIFALFRKD
tara:strand:+ start:288 stop:500 length:213 start_codon:yes stop_codon:yes gene_type:complete